LEDVVAGFLDHGALPIWTTTSPASTMPTIRFLEDRPLDEVSIRSVRGLAGLYFIYLINQLIPYPFRASRLIYIGMSESKQNSIGNRLRAHLAGQSGNPGLTNYICQKGARFSYLSFDFLSVLGISTVAELEGVFLRDFLKSNGAYPISNNQSGIELKEETVAPRFEIEWEHFE
jgi:hypothetical protein